MLFGCISISMASLMRRSLYLVFVERSLVSCNLMKQLKKLKHGESLKTNIFVFIELLLTLDTVKRPGRTGMSSLKATTSRNSRSAGRKSRSKYLTNLCNQNE